MSDLYKSGAVAKAIAQLPASSSQISDQAWEAFEKQMAASTLAYWLDHPGKLSAQLAESDGYWQEQFRRYGKFRARYSGVLTGNTLTSSSFDGVEFDENLELTVPLYQAEPAWFSSRWDWYEDFAIARHHADSRGTRVPVLTCDPEEVFGCVDFERYDNGNVQRWRQWIVAPRSTRVVNRWRQHEQVEAGEHRLSDEKWRSRGLKALDAAGIVAEWTTPNLQGAPMDRETAAYWIRQFKMLGQFQAVETVTREGVTFEHAGTIEPATGLVPGGRLYRGAPDELKDRWSWTTELHAARAFADERRRSVGIESTIWTCDAEEVYGRVDFILPPELKFPSHTEWIVEPRNVRPFVPDDDQDTPTTVAGVAEQMNATPEDVERILRQKYPDHPEDASCGSRCPRSRSTTYGGTFESGCGVTVS